MKVGKLRRRISLLSAASSQDPETGVITEGGWAPFATAIPASIEPVSAREFIASGATQAQVTHRIVIRFRADVTPEQRCQDEDGNVYAIQAVLPDKESGREYLTLVCSQGVEQG